MKALLWTGPRQFEMTELSEPELRPDEVLVKVAYVGICGSELSGYLGHNALRVPPLIMGHEFSGEVSAFGSAVHAEHPHLKLEQPVTVNPLSCQTHSEFQQRGLDHLCPSRQLLGAHRPGAFAEFVAVPARSVSPLPTGVALRPGALTEPVACAVRIGELAGPLDQAAYLIIGAGPIGVLTLQVLIDLGARRVFIADRDPERLAMGAACGGIPLDPRHQDVVAEIHAATDGRGVAVAIDAVGATITREQCVAACMPTGTVILSGLHEESSELPAADIIRREIIVRGSFAYSPANFAGAVHLLETGRIRLDPWIVEAPLSEGQAWFERLISAPGDVSKVLLVP